MQNAQRVSMSSVQLEEDHLLAFLKELLQKFSVFSEKRKRTQPPGSEMSEDYPKENDSST